MNPENSLSEYRVKVVDVPFVTIDHPPDIANCPPLGLHVKARGGSQDVISPLKSMVLPAKLSRLPTHRLTRLPP